MIYSSILAWKIPWTEEPGQLQSMGSQRVRHNWACMQEYSTGCYCLVAKLHLMRRKGKTGSHVVLLAIVLTCLLLPRPAWAMSAPQLIKPLLEFLLLAVKLIFNWYKMKATLSVLVSIKISWTKEAWKGVEEKSNKVMLYFCINKYNKVMCIFGNPSMDL